jgi:hypothetical protein
MDGVSLDWERCPDGVDLVDGRFRHCSARRAAVRHEITNLENPLIVRFINARTDDDLAAFFGRAGLPGGQDAALGFDHGHALRMRDDLAALLRIAGGSRSNKHHWVNQHLGGLARMAPRLDPQEAGDPPRLMLQAEGYFDFMIMEAVMVAVHGATLTSCQHCRRAFLIGPLTFRRSHAKFCGDRCRVAALRARNAGAR